MLTGAEGPRRRMTWRRVRIWLHGGHSEGGQKWLRRNSRGEEVDTETINDFENFARKERKEMRQPLEEDVGPEGVVVCL